MTTFRLLPLATALVDLNRKHLAIRYNEQSSPVLPRIIRVCISSGAESKRSDAQTPSSIFPKPPSEIYTVPLPL